jgi:hypothetical protein
MIAAVDWLGSIIGWVLGAAIVWCFRREFRNRPELARRRAFHRKLLGGGAFLVLFAAMAWFLTVAAATSGDPADHNDAMMFAWVGLALAVAGAGLLVLWWRLAGQRS